MEHLHGKFVYPFVDPNQLRFFSYGNTQFEYPYLFGASSLEKINRIEKIKKEKGIYSESYDLGFFFDSELQLGNLLIFGISFLESGIYNEKLINAYPKYKDKKK